MTKPRLVSEVAKVFTRQDLSSSTAAQRIKASASDNVSASFASLQGLRVDGGEKFSSINQPFSH
jgi:hypothetical protein